MRRSGARRRDEISLDEILPFFHEDRRYADPIVDSLAELKDPAVQTELRSVLTSALEELRIAIVPARRRRLARLLLRQRLGEFMSGAPSGVEMVSHRAQLA